MRSTCNKIAIYEKNKVLFILLLFVFCSPILEAQQKPSTAQIKVIARNHLDSVTIRWAPNKATAWKVLNNFGYILERRTVYKNKQYIIDHPEIKKLSDMPIRPFTKDQFEKWGDTTTDVLIVYQALYGESFQLNTSESDVGPVAMINKAKELDNRYSFALFSADHSSKAAKAHGLWFTDKDVKAGEKYIYRVYSAVPDTIMKIDSGFIYVDMADTFVVPKPYDVKVEFRNHAAIVSWNREFFENIFITYIVERSDDNGKTFHSLNDLPIINPYTEPDNKPLRHLLIDSLPKNGFAYQYRVIGITPFGEISPPSDIVEGSGYETGEMLNPDIIKYDITPDNKIVIKWKVGPDSVYVKGFDVIRAPKNDGPYKKLNISPLSVSTRIFIDSFPGAVNYYRINALDSKSRIFPSFTEMVQLVDSTPPAVPVNVTGFIDSAGLVHLKWDRNTEIDFASYRVFKANNPLAEFVKVNQEPVYGNSYTDTTILKTLSPYIYYRVTAIDQRYNQSDYSGILRLKRPDIVPPASPSITSYEVTDTAVILSWIPSPSEDVIKHLIYRKNTNGTGETMIAAIDSSLHIANYKDSIAEDGSAYIYTILAVDDAGLKSDSVSATIKIPVRAEKPGVTAFEVKINYSIPAIELNWKYKQNGVESFLIYRSDNENALTRYRSVLPVENKYTDRGIRKEITYGYCIQAVFNDGSKSKMSELIKVKY